MQEVGQNVEATGSTRLHIKLWNKIGSVSMICYSKSAIFQDWERLGNVVRQGIRQECFKIGKSSAM